MKEIRFNEIIDNLNNINIIDIRDNYLYNIESVPNSKNIPMNFLLMNPSNYLDKNNTYYIYCNRGINSKKTCEILTSVGFNVINIVGGYLEYQRIIDK